MFRDGAADRSLHEEEEPSALSASSPALAQKACWCLLPPGFYRHLCISSSAPLFSSCLFEYFPVRFSFFPFSPPSLSPQGCQKMSGRKYAKTLRLLRQRTERGGGNGRSNIWKWGILVPPFFAPLLHFFSGGKKKEEPPPSGKRFAEFLPCFVCRIKVTLIRHKLWYLECLFSQKNMPEYCQYGFVSSSFFSGDEEKVAPRRPLCERRWRKRERDTPR